MSVSLLTERGGLAAAGTGLSSCRDNAVLCGMGGQASAVSSSSPSSSG